MDVVLDKPQCNCAVVGVYGHPNASVLAYQSLYAMQHRGPESSGIVSSDGVQVYRHVDLGLANDVFADGAVLDKLSGHMAVGHNRYSTTGATLLHNAQPLLVNFREGPVSMSHNGNFVNTRVVREALEEEGAIFQTTTDTEVALHLMARSREQSIVGKLQDAFRQIIGAYSIAMIGGGKVIGVRDPHGWRPLCIGRKDDAYFLVSETCALDLIGASYVRDVEPGEIVIFDENGFTSERLDEAPEQRACIFEFVYFSRPDSRVFNQNVDKARRRLGETLATEHPADADIVISVPDSSNTAALGYAQVSGMKYEIGLIRNHYVGRTFLHPEQSAREFKARVKYNPIRGVLEDKRVVLVDDSLIRGTTLVQLAMMVRRAGAQEVHVRISSPPVISPCFYGMDFPTTDELIASRLQVDEIRRFLGVESLGYLSLQGMLEACGGADFGFCDACFTGNYPLPPEINSAELKLEPV